MSSKLSPYFEESSFVDAVDELMVTLDLDLRIQWANRAAGDSINEDPGNLMGRPCYRVWFGRESPCEGCSAQATLRTEQSGECEIESPGGRHWHIRSYPVRSRRGKLKGVAVLAREITDRKRAERTRMDSEKRFHWAMEATGEGVWDWDLTTDSVSYSPAYLTMLGYSPEEARCSPSFWMSHLHPEDRDFALQANRECIRNRRESFEIEFRMVTRNGDTRWILGRGTVVARDEQGLATRLVGTHADITVRKQTEEHLRYHKQLLETIINEMPDVLAIQHPDHTIERYNRAGYTMFGLSPEQARGKKCFQVLGRDRECRTCAASRTLETQEPASEQKFIPELGIHVDCRTSPVLDGAGNVVRIVEHLRDISEQKDFEVRLQAERDYMFQIFNTMSQYIIVESPNYRTEFMNRAARERFGNLVGTICYESLDRKTPCPQCPIEEALARGDSLEPVHYSLEAFGRILEGTATKLTHQDGSASVLKVLDDVTEREHAKNSLIRSESYYRTLFEASGSAKIIVDRDTTIALANANFEELTGYSGEEIEGIKSWMDFVHPEDLAWMKESHDLRHQDPSAAPTQYEFRLLTRNFEERNIFLSIGMIPGTNQRLASGIDITERKRTERILQARLRLMEYSLAHSLEEILTATVDEAEYLTKSRMGFYHLLQEDQRTLSMHSWSTRTRNRLCTIPTPEKRFDIEKAGVWADCIRTGEPVIHNDYASLPHKKGVPHGHPSVVRELLLPVYKGKTIKALLGVANKPGNYTSEDVETVSLLANLARDIIERKHMEERFKELSIHDTLTGLYNRNLFEEEMDRLKKDCLTPVGIVVCDIDGLKFVNDTLGHQYGDQMLKETADFLRGYFRSSDIIARIGGDEFAILLPQTPKDAVERILQRLRQAMREFNSLDPEVPLSLSLGHAVCEKDPSDMFALFREADNRMYREKIQCEESARSAILQALTGSMRARDFNTEGHCDRLQKLVSSLAHALHLSQNLVNDLHLFALFHDLGKVGIPDHILFKTGPLNEDEWHQMRQHCEIGHRIASTVPDLEPIADWILKHHERWDGKGYPLGLSGRDIPLPCRMLAIVDAYDAMTSDRPYRAAMSREEAIAELKRCSGTQFDPELVESFLRILRNSSGEPS